MTKRKPTEEQKEIIRKARSLVQVDKLTYEQAEAWIKFLDLRNSVYNK